MKKLLLVFIALTFIFTGCKKEYPIPDCELYEYGYTTIINKTGYDGLVDCTYHVDDVNNNIFLYHGESAEYKMDEGRIYIWISVFEDEWVYEIEHLDSCEDLEFTWYMDKKKSTASDIHIETKLNGEIVQLNGKLMKIDR